jgi:hypothetical protein
MKPILLGLALAVAGVSAAQSTLPPRPIRIPIRHADPWMVKAMLEGMPVVQPEYSTLPGFAGMGGGATQGLSSLLSGGKLVVNPTDNSLWFFPDWKR